MRVCVYAAEYDGYSTVATAFGFNVLDHEDHVVFAGEPRLLHEIGRAIAAAESKDELPEADIEEWQIIGHKRIKESSHA